MTSGPCHCSTESSSGCSCSASSANNFLYVADCKLASSENLSHIATRGCRFVTVFPRGRSEDVAFRQRLRTTPSALKEQAVAEVLAEAEASSWLLVEIEEQEEETFRQATRGRPSEQTKYSGWPRSAGKSKPSGPFSHDAGWILHASNTRPEIQPRRTSSTIACLTEGVMRCHVATSSRSASQSRHPSDSPWVQFSQSQFDKVLASIGMRVQFPPPPHPIL